MIHFSGLGVMIQGGGRRAQPGKVGVGQVGPEEERLAGREGDLAAARASVGQGARGGSGGGVHGNNQIHDDSKNRRRGVWAGWGGGGEGGT